MSNISATIEVVSPKQAAAWLDHNYSHNRPLNPGHVAMLAREMKLGRFTLATIHFMYVGPEVHLINGQHTLHAIVESGKSQTCTVIRQQNCTPDDLPSMFMHYDIQRSRNFQDSVRAFDLDKRIGVKGYWLNAAASAIKYGFAGFGGVKGRGGGKVYASNRTGSRYLSIADLFEIVPKWADEINLITSAIEGGDSVVVGVIRTAKVFSVALITAYYQPTKAIDFWHGVAFDDGLSIGDPRKTLHGYLPKTMRKERLSAPEPVPADVVTKAVSYCWNAYYEDRLYSRVSVAKTHRDSNIVIDGTPYSGNQHPLFWPTRNQERAAA